MFATSASSHKIAAATARVNPKGTAVVPEGARQEVDGEVQPGAGDKEFLHLGVGFAPADRLVQLDGLQLRHADSEAAG